MEEGDSEIWVVPRRVPTDAPQGRGDSANRGAVQRTEERVGLWTELICGREWFHCAACNGMHIRQYGPIPDAEVPVPMDTPDHAAYLADAELENSDSEEVPELWVDQWENLDDDESSDYIPN